jgi:hypothetical protein
MTTYKHKQVSWFMIAIALVMLVFFGWLQVTSRLEPASADSGANFLVTGVMMLVVFVLASFSSLTVSVDEQSVKIRFGWGIFRKQFLLAQVATVKQVKNPWYYSWGIHYWLWPKMWIFNIAGLGAVELTMKNGKVYRIGTNEPEKLEAAIKQNVHYHA